MIVLSEPQVDDSMQRPLPPLRPCSILKTSALGFALWWFMLLALHIVNLAYYVGVAMLYTENRVTNLEFQLDTYSIGISFREWGRVSVVHIIVAVVHAGCILSMLIGSLAAGRLAFQPRSSRLLRMYRKRIARKVTTTDARHTLPRQDSLVFAIAKAAVRFVSGIFGREGLLGVDGVFFDHLHLTREFLETALQTIQCYRMSYLLPRVWLIRFYAVLLVANCWSMPMLHRYYGDRHVERRMMSLLCDAVLDVVSSIGVSFWIFATYAPQYTDPVFGFPFDYWFEDVWFANMQQEFQMMLIVSWADMASRLVLALGLLQCMDAMKDLLTPAVAEEAVESIATDETSRQSFSRVCAQRQTGIVQGETHKQVRPVGVVSSPPTAEDDALNECCRRPLVPRPIDFVLYVAGPGIFIVWGLLIICLHSVAEVQYHASYGCTCNLRLQPWFVSKPACSLVEIDCHALGNLSGTLDSLRDAWNTFQPGATARLVLRHCAQLEIPPTISRFTILSGLKIYNSTINSWPADAALAEPAHTSMRAVFLIRCRLRDGVLPPGLVSDQFPRGFKSVIVMDTDLASLPTNLHELWPQGMTLTLERTMIITIPECIMHLRPMVLSFAGSPIETVPASLFEIPTVECVLLSYTKVQALPRSVATPSSRWYLLLLQGTNVSTFWSWMDPFIEYSMWYQNDFFNAYETPYCHALQEIAAGTITAFPSHPSESTALASVMDVSTPERLARSQQAVACTPGFPFYFPLDLEDMAHEIAD